MDFRGVIKYPSLFNLLLDHIKEFINIKKKHQPAIKSLNDKCHSSILGLIDDPLPSSVCELKSTFKIFKSYN